ncbi:PREDICTED: mitochondrial import receptor subunit TOM34 [Calidris pugnax]|uniref:mitochondrial import receptor subunit TOM34 n=1 Tax=Calidris pugnax TaxID=198806 RepID=UPI00071C36CF|nr:PREDICTED: mitochondrial import receptor subunit TOM34 [Calidris pugnax]
MAASPGSLRRAGNEEFRRGQYGAAAELYTRALALLEAAGEAAAEERSVLLANRAACRLKDGACRLCVADCSEMTKALLEKDGVNWRQKLPPIPAVPVSAQTRWSVPSAGAPGANPPPATAPKGEPDRTGAGTERARALKEEGNELVKKGNHKKAVEKYSESLQLNQECATYTNRALCYLTLKQYKDAVQDCTEALRLDPKNVKALYRRAQALKELKDYKSSIADIKSLLKTEPKNTAALRLLQELNRA